MVKALKQSPGVRSDTKVATTKRKRFSKKTKKAWRKRTNLEDVEQFLEERIREERTGGDPTIKQNKELFYIDKSHIFEDRKTLKCHSELEIDTRVQAVSSYSGPSKRKKKRKKKVSVSNDQTPVVDKQQKMFGHYDLWSSPNTTDKQLDPCLPAPVRKPPKYQTSETKTPAVVLPHPGQSYNPSFSSHQELLQEALIVEEKREKEKAKIKRDAAPNITVTEEEFLKEMSQGLEERSEVSTDEELPNKDESVNVAPRHERKTRTQRNKERLEKQKTQELKEKKKDKELELDLRRLKSIKKDLNKEELNQATITEKRRIKKAEKKLRPGKFGPNKFLEEQDDFMLPEEVDSSLRKLHPQGSMVLDRFTSLQKRNMIEVRRKVIPHRTYKVKYVEKWRMKLPQEMKELTKIKHKTKTRKKIKLAGS